MPRILLIVLLVILTLPVTGWAETPTPGRKTDIDTLQKKLAQEKKKQGDLESQLRDIKGELDKTRSSLVKIGKQIRDNENELARLEQRISERSAEEKELTAKLEGEYGSISGLILALERIRRIPPEALIVRPGAPLQTAQSAMLLESTLPAVNKRAEQLSADLKRLRDITTELQQDRGDALAARKELNERYASMKELADKREKLYGMVQGDYQQNKRRVARLSQEAKTLMDLINKLEKDQQRRSATRTASALTSLPAPGRGRLPVTGTILEAFGQPNAIGAVSQGIMMESQPGSLVVAPMGGIVRFAGTFKNYGNMVIIEHKNGYHSLIAGLQRIDTGIDNQVKPGEPIGQLPLTSSRGGRPALYYELRHNGQPVDPAGLFSELKT